jgi:5-methyltetrahydropteroyltriglutamate--homocysteine methyltransferase
MCHRTITAIDSVNAIGVDLVRGTKTLELIKEFGLPENKKLVAGVVDGRNIWANDLAASLTLLEGLVAKLGKGKATRYFWQFRLMFVPFRHKHWRNLSCHACMFCTYLLSCLLTAERVTPSTSCSLLHSPVDLKNETKLDDEIKSWLAFAAQKVHEVVALANALEGNKDEVLHITSGNCIKNLYSLLYHREDELKCY